MARTLILNISALVQTMPAIYGSYPVSVGHGRVVSDETSVAVAEMGGFAAIDGKWVVYPVSTDTAEGDYDVAAGGVALLATFVPGGEGGGGGPVNWADILGKPAFADVAETGDYADLSGTPTIPSASNDAATGVGSSSAAGVSSAFSRADHQHAHGSQAGGSLHSAATTVSAGFMSAADKAKLDGLENFSGAYADLTGTPALADVATSGDASDLSNQPYDFAANAVGELTVNQIVLRIIAPRALILESLAQASTTTAVIELRVNGTAASFPQSVAQGALITAVVTTGGTNCWFSITGKVA